MTPRPRETRARCRHSGSWLMVPGPVGYEWCWGCGGIRKLREARDGAMAVISDWAYPGRGVNPWAKFDKSITRRAKKP